MKHIKVGTYNFCRMNIDLFLIPGYSSEVITRPNDKDRPAMLLGVDHLEWWKILDELLHEATEYCLNIFGHTFVPTLVEARNSTTSSYHFTHGDLVLVCEEVAFLQAKCLQDLFKAWKKHHRSK